MQDKIIVKGARANNLKNIDVTIPRRRQEVCACADRPAEHFFFSTGRGAEGELPRRGKRSPSGGFSF